MRVDWMLHCQRLSAWSLFTGPVERSARPNVWMARPESPFAAFTARRQHYSRLIELHRKLMARFAPRLRRIGQIKNGFNEKFSMKNCSMRTLQRETISMSNSHWESFRWKSTRFIRLADSSTEIQISMAIRFRLVEFMKVWILCETNFWIDPDLRSRPESDAQTFCWRWRAVKRFRKRCRVTSPKHVQI